MRVIFDKRIKAYFTVEAALILPLIIGTIVYIICFLLFWYNRCVMEQEIAVYAVKGAQSRIEEPEQLRIFLEECKAEYLSDQYVGWEMENPVYAMENREWKLKRKGSLFGEEANWKAEAVFECRWIYPADYLRLSRKTRLLAGSDRE